jgi:hypothetical protein
VLDAAREQRLGALDHHRGRTALAAPAQVAEHEVRAGGGGGPGRPPPPVHTLLWKPQQLQAQLRHPHHHSRSDAAIAAKLACLEKSDRCGGLTKF